VRVPLLVTDRYCTGDRPPDENVKEVADGVARQVPDVTVCAWPVCAFVAADARPATTAHMVRRTTANAAALLTSVSL
jgi:hypothetical protein